MALEVMTWPEYQGKTVLICWNHGELPDIATALGVWPRPDDWNGEVFDRLWKIDFDAEARVVSFKDLPERLLPGDSST